MFIFSGILEFWSKCSTGRHHGNFKAFESNRFSEASSGSFLFHQGAPGKCELYELFMNEYFSIIYLQTSILNHHTFPFSSAVLPVPIVIPLPAVTD